MDRKKNRWKYGIWSAFVTILGVLLAVILVWVAERATERFGLKFDLTANDRYAISEQSVSWLKKLDQDVKITVLVNEEDMATGSYYIVQAYQNLLEYERNSDRITLEFVDITENPTFVSKYPDLELEHMISFWNQESRRKSFHFRIFMTMIRPEVRSQRPVWNKR